MNNLSNYFLVEDFREAGEELTLRIYHPPGTAFPSGPRQSLDGEPGAQRREVTWLRPSEQVQNLGLRLDF